MIDDGWSWFSRFLSLLVSKSRTNSYRTHEVKSEVIAKMMSPGLPCLPHLPRLHQKPMPTNRFAFLIHVSPLVHFHSSVLLIADLWLSLSRVVLRSGRRLFVFSDLTGASEVGPIMFLCQCFESDETEVSHIVW